MDKLITWILGVGLFLVHAFLAVVGMIVSVFATLLTLVLILAPFFWLLRWLLG